MPSKYAYIIEKLGGDSRSLVSKLFDDAHLNRIEIQLGYVLPIDYRDFLLNYPGISFERVSFPIDNGDGGLRCLYGSGNEETIADDYFELLNNYESPDEWEDSDPNFEWFPGIHLVRDCPTPTRNINWPKELLPIGGTLGNNDICLAMFGLRPNAIFYMRNNPHEGQPNIYLVADSFDEFMHLLSREG